jgi:hypothetical protein
LFFRSGEICFSVCCWLPLAAKARCFLWSEDVSPEVVDLSFFPDFVDGRAAVLGARQHGDIPRSMCHNDMSLAACSGPVGDGALLDLATVEA